MEKTTPYRKSAWTTATGEAERVATRAGELEIAARSGKKQKEWLPEGGELERVAPTRGELEKRVAPTRGELERVAPEGGETGDPKKA
ncbi:hypothetical protein H6P81_014688 [Aristolochia fimbriata]|uniref:Uncharacterized protein n=1 Tax=Aristolochia fimbriata TaxID=158543 RepID=A0AAV7E3D6_ARIFI|nr:hypothetical protein H6P81_014688 [Aristolochia fimbriata]